MRKAQTPKVPRFTDNRRNVSSYIACGFGKEKEEVGGSKKPPNLGEEDEL